MKQEEKKSMLSDISAKKKELMMMRIKVSSGETVSVNLYRDLKKQIARLFTKLNDNKILKV
jgi:ribosomal protein L29